MKLDNKTNIELLQIKENVCCDPTSSNPTGGIFLYTAAARKKLDAIDRAITENMRVARVARGNAPTSDGYSGRKSNRRK